MLYLFRNLLWPSFRIKTHLQIFCKDFANQMLQYKNIKIFRNTNTKCYTFSETSCDPLSGSKFICRFFAKLLQTLFCTPKIYRLLEILLLSAIHFWKPHVTLYQDFNSFADFLQTLFIQTSRNTSTKGYLFRNLWWPSFRIANFLQKFGKPHCAYLLMCSVPFCKILMTASP